MAGERMMMDSANIRWPNSLWAAVTPPGPDLSELTGTNEADVVVIGGGFTGLSTALHLREAGGDVFLGGAIEPGWGASRRHNGQAIPTLSRCRAVLRVRCWSAAAASMCARPRSVLNGTTGAGWSRQKKDRSVLVR